MRDTTTYLATQILDGEEFDVKFRARDWSDAEAHCEAAGYTLRGISKGSYLSSPRFGEQQAEEICKLLNESQHHIKN